MKSCIAIATSLIAISLLAVTEAFSNMYKNNRREYYYTSLSAENNEKGDFFGGVKEFFQELDNFLDDATARRLGNGAAFYGKRKSNFYGKNDKNRKANPNQPDPLEDFQAPLNGGYFQWMPDENGDLRPVTRMKKKVVERNPNFWDKFYEKESK